MSAFPTKGLSERKQEEWLQANNPYAPGTVIGHYFERDFYLSQAEIFRTKANRLGKWAIGILIFGGVMALVSVIAAVLA
ncbi:hypothetical protein [Arthrobacter sp. USHLN218]|uniref:hypothetical protein n=1 Tax=Arthrobacter sp. USHLN218 TaxID=3081232 RepID=UPI0030193861